MMNASRRGTSSGSVVAKVQALHNTRGSRSRGRPPPLCRRWFNNLAAYEQWRTKVNQSRLADSTQSLVRRVLAQEAPFLYSVAPMADHLELHAYAKDWAVSGSPRASLLQCRFPLASDELLRNSVMDVTNWSTFRLGKFYETVDALTADVGYRHCATSQQEKEDPSINLVTAGHYHSRKIKRTDLGRDVYLRSYLTYVGSSSMEVRTDALQYRPEDGQDELVNVCHTIMVALDKTTHQSITKSGRTLNPLIVVADHQDELDRVALARQHQEIRRMRGMTTLQLRYPSSSPPVAKEMQDLHKLHQRQKEATSVEQLLPRVCDFTFRSSTIIYPENRNVHGKLFGGFVMGEAQNLAQYTATCFAKGAPIVPLGIDEAIFLQPISIGDLVTFTARLVHATNQTCRVLVVVEVRDPADTSRDPLRSNRLMFVFGGANFRTGVLPDRYGEILMQIDAKRRHQEEGPTDADVTRILNESESLAAHHPL
jgi:acyl-coenzyme A thioesterase 9